MPQQAGFGFTKYGQPRLWQTATATWLADRADVGPWTMAQLQAAVAAGPALWPQPLPPVPGLAGLPLFSQVGWLDPCGPQGFSASRGLGLGVRP